MSDEFNEVDKNEFKIDNEKKEELSKLFKVNKEEVEELYNMYKEFSEYLKEHHLAHVMRGIECYIREHLKFKRFIVICKPYDKILDEQKPASSMYNPPILKKLFKACYHNNNNQSSFIINYNDDLPPKEKRDYIAHEIGHLLYRILLSKNNKEKLSEIWSTRETDAVEEKKSSILGVLIMSEKNDFYLNFERMLQNHKDWKKLVKHFEEITHAPMI